MIRAPFAPRRRRPGAAVVPALVAATGLLAACSGGGSATGSAGRCGEPVREPIDPNSAQHVLSSAGVTYRTNPPTSGPHLSSPAPTGAVDVELDPAVQVTILERTDVVVQYRGTGAGGPDAAGIAALRALAGEHVVIAPNSTLPDPVMATAWGYKLSCSGPDLDAIRRFITAHAGRAIG